MNESLEITIDIDEFFKKYAPWVNGNLATLEKDTVNAVLSNIKNVIVESTIELPFKDVAFNSIMFLVNPIEKNGKKLLPIMNYKYPSENLTIMHIIFNNVDFQSEPLLILYPNIYSDGDSDLLPLILYFVRYNDKPYFVLVFPAKSPDLEIADDDGMIIILTVLPAEKIRDFYIDMIPIVFGSIDIEYDFKAVLEGMLTLKQTFYEMLANEGVSKEIHQEVIKNNSIIKFDMKILTKGEGLTTESLKSVKDIGLFESLIDVGNNIYYMLKLKSLSIPVTVTVYMKPPYTYSSVEKYIDEQTKILMFMGFIGYSLIEQQYDLGIDLNKESHNLPEINVVVNFVDKQAFIDIGGITRADIGSQELFNTTDINIAMSKVGFNLLMLGKYFGATDVENILTPHFISSLVKKESYGGLINKSNQ